LQTGKQARDLVPAAADQNTFKEFQECMPLDNRQLEQPEVRIKAGVQDQLTAQVLRK
jgi:hypothetical protein